jgi:hypothetical protein
MASPEHAVPAYSFAREIGGFDTLVGACSRQLNTKKTIACPHLHDILAMAHSSLFRMAMFAKGGCCYE